MENNQETPVVTEQPTGHQGQEPANNPTAGQPSGPTQQPDRTFTRDEVTKILRNRLDRYQNSVYKKYGVKNLDEFNSLFEKAKGYDDVIKSRDEALETVAFLRNNINPDKYDDVKTYFKGKGLQFTEDALKQQLESHPEWVIKKAEEVNKKPVTTITPVGTGSKGPIVTGEKELAKKIFGDDLFD